jgi:CheY-like chemotaxis protein
MKTEETPISRIVLADDDLDHGILFRHILKKVRPSAEIRIAHNGDQLLPLLGKFHPDILFLDLNMPCKNGFECLQELRQDEQFNKLPVVVYSSSAKMSDIQKSYLHEADLYMVKPFNADHLRTALESILNMDWRQASSFKRHYFINNRFVPFTA